MPPFGQTQQQARQPKGRAERGIKMVTPRGTDKAEVINVIETVSLCGSGEPNDPCRIIKQYWSLDGELLAEKDCAEVPMVGRTN